MDRRKIMLLLFMFDLFYLLSKALIYLFYVIWQITNSSSYAHLPGMMLKIATQ